MSKRLLDAETRYPELEKLALALMVASKKLRPLSCTPDRGLNQLPTALSATKARCLKQVPQVGDRVVVVQCELPPSNGDKGQALADFIAEFTYSNAAEVTGTADSVEVAKVAEVRGREDSVPTKGTLNNGPYM